VSAGPPPRLGDATLAHLRLVVDRPLVEGTRYELQELLGRGGMGMVWRARDRTLDREVALKVLAAPAATAELVARLLQEARVLAQLEHPGIVPVHDTGVLPDGRAYYAMKLVQGQPLDQLLRSGLPAAERLRIFARIGEAVAFAHARGVIHCDLKPGNIMVGPFGEALVLDWGLALVHTAAGGGAAPGMRAGTEGFMAPEQQGGGALDARTDVFALGRLLERFELRGREIRAIVATATAARPADRYPGVLELAADVLRFQAGDRVTALPDGPLAWLGRCYRKYRAAVWLVATYAVLRIGFEVVRAWLAARNP